MAHSAAIARSSADLRSLPAPAAADAGSQRGAGSDGFCRGRRPGPDDPALAGTGGCGARGRRCDADSVAAALLYRPRATGVRACDRSPRPQPGAVRPRLRWRAACKRWVPGWRASWRVWCLPIIAIFRSHHCPSDSADLNRAGGRDVAARARQGAGVLARQSGRPYRGLRARHAGSAGSGRCKRGRSVSAGARRGAVAGLKCRPTAMWR